ncbi:MAG: SRPBCC family protein [Prevotellaceae bacterium]|jgi:hypothetical protein|nr:SRPBCC family protein [Prevotellaceae bacterium]
MTATSTEKEIPFGATQVYARLSDLTNLETLRERLPESRIQGLSFTEDTLSFAVPSVGTITLRITECQPDVLIGFSTVASPLPFLLNIHLTPVSDAACRLRLEIVADVNPLVGGMLKKPMADSAEKIAAALALLPYA